MFLQNVFQFQIGAIGSTVKNRVCIKAKVSIPDWCDW